MAFPSSNITTLVPNSGEFSMRIATNGSYMTILNSEVTSSDQNVIPDDAFSVRTNFASMSNLITSADVEVDTSKISKGTTWVTVSFANGNVSSQKGTIVVRLTVSDSVAVDVWTETLTFDVNALTGVFAKFTVAVYNADYRPGMPQELEYQEFADLQAENGKITVVIRYVEGQTFRLGLFGYTDDASSFTELTTLDSVGEGSSAAGFNQYKDGVLSFTRDDAALTIRVQDK